MDHRIDHAWHVAINRFHEKARERGEEHRHWMYEAKHMAAEVPRLAKLFEMERFEHLPETHKQCSREAPEPVEDNHLTCCLGIECRECPELLSLDSAELPFERIDELKAWTCVAHIVSEGGDKAMEGYILTEDDKRFWQRTYASMAGEDPG